MYDTIFDSDCVRRRQRNLKGTRKTRKDYFALSKLREKENISI